MKEKRRKPWLHWSLQLSQAAIISTAEYWVSNDRIVKIIKPIARIESLELYGKCKDLVQTVEYVSNQKWIVEWIYTIFLSISIAGGSLTTG